MKKKKKKGAIFGLNNDFNEHSKTTAISTEQFLMASQTEQL